MKKIFICIVCGLLLAFSTASLVACKSKYDANYLRDARQKAYSGEKLSKEEEIMVDGFHEWKAEQE